MEKKIEGQKILVVDSRTRCAMLAAMQSTVYLVEQKRYFTEEIRSSVRQILEQERLEVGGKSVFLKPSFVYPARPPANRGVNTQPEFVGGVARALVDLGARKIWVGEDCLVGPSQSGFLAMGVLPFIRGIAEPVYLQDEPRTLVSVKSALIEKQFSMPKRLMEADLFISLPKLKVNMYSKVTLSAKNHIGLLLQKDRLSHHHYQIHKKIADLYRTRIPDFVLTDAITAGEGQGPMHAHPVHLKLLLAGRNGVAVDAVSCKLIGMDPPAVEHLMHLHELGLGPIDLKDMDIKGRDLLNTHVRCLARPRTDFNGLPPTIHLFRGTELACEGGCMGMIRGSLDSWMEHNRLRSLEGLTFLTGKPLENLPEKLNARKTFVVGDCAEPHRKRGCFIAGCPPAPMDIVYALARKGILPSLSAKIGDLAWGMIAHSLGIDLK